ncbi:MAG: D-aminoacylase [Candidatus Bathyarchaeota archaeon]|nr:D-aminoacylase [Candidatus Bathyarchaeota archaeon]
MYDVLVKGGRIIDGSGSPGYLGDVAIKDGTISQIGDIDEDAAMVLDATSLVVAPGFIDTHSHSDLFLIHEPEARAKVMQGITTEIVGQDGLGEAPIRDDVKDEWRKYLSGLNGDPPIEWTWNSFNEYLNRVQDAEPAVNVASLVGHGNLRLLAMGMNNRDPEPEELSAMKVLLAESLEQGARGLSTGLIYAPCVYSKAPELSELCKVTAEHDGVFVVHMRNEGDQLLESMEEVLGIGRESGVHVHISHFKAGGEANWGKSKKSLKRLEEASEQGIKVSYDQYPYTAGSTFLSSLLPAWVHEGGVEKLLERLSDASTRLKVVSEYSERLQTGRATGWEKVLVTYVESEMNKELEGLSLAAIAKKRGQSEIDSLIDIVLEEANQASMASFTMSEEDIERIMAHPLGMTCTDGLLLGTPHPRAYGAFPRVLGRYVRKGVVGLEEAVRRMTGYPAQVFRLEKRGLLKTGYHADVTIFDPDTINDTATYIDPRRHPEGIHHVLVNGRITVKDGLFTGARAGHVLRS